MARALPFLLDLLALALLVGFLVTQIILPFARGTKVFPWFRKRRQELAAELTELHEQADVLDLEQEVKQALEAVEAKRSRLVPRYSNDAPPPAAAPQTPNPGAQ